MAAKSAFASVLRTVDYLRDIKLEKNCLHVRRTGARVKLDRSFLRSSISVLEIYTYLIGLRLWRLVQVLNPTRKRAKTISFFPQAAPPWYNIWSVVQLAGYKTVTEVDEADIVFLFEDSTYSNAAVKLPEKLDGLRVNHECANISKQYVADLFEDVFGYPLTIDPTSHRGKAIRKSQHNGAHDGVVIECPIKQEDVLPGYAYQKLVNSTKDGARTEDLRIAYVFGRIPVVFHKYKAINKRFGTEYLNVILKEASEAFSSEEIERIIAYCRKIGLDFGAVNVMRDEDDGRIYIVDVNKTCMPVLTLPFGQQIKAYRRISDAFMAGVDDKNKAQ